MKNLSVKYILASLFPLALAAYDLPAQDFLVTSQGDTLRGDLKPFTIGPGKKVVITLPDKTKSTYPILKVRSYMLDGEEYHPVRSERGYEFMKVIRHGYLTWYAYQMENQSRFDGQFLAKKDGQFLEVPNLSFKKLMAKFLDDCPLVSEKIASGELEKRDLDQIVTQYNECIINRTVDHDRVLRQQKKTTTTTMSWTGLEDRIKAHAEFDRKADALEMVADIKGRINREEKIPNFIIEGLKQALEGTELTADLEAALRQTQN
jgi:hypothetical protein